MRKETTAALFVILLLLSTSVATVSAYEWGRREEEPLPPDVVPYLVTIDETYIENWWAEPDYYKGIYVIKLTAGYIEMTNVSISVFGQSASFMSGSDMTLYATEIRVQVMPGFLIIITPEMLEDFEPPRPIEELRALFGDPTTIPISYQELDMICMEASDVIVSGFASVTYPDEVTLKSKCVVMSSYDIVADDYDGTAVTKITAGELTIKDSSMIVADDYTYTLNAPMTVMENAEVYTTYVKGLGLRFIPLKWSGDNIPWLVRLARMLFSKMSLNLATMHVVSLSADSATMSMMKLDISA